MMEQFVCSNDVDMVNCIGLEENWEEELEIIGAAASPQELKIHLLKAPNPTSMVARDLAKHLETVGDGLGYLQ